MTQKTALTELIEEIKKERDSFGWDTYTMKMFKDVLELAESKLLPKERQDLIDFHVETMKQGLIEEGELKWSEAYEPKIREQAEQYLKNKFGI